MKRLRQAIVALEAASYRPDPVDALRQWRLAAAKAYVRRGSGQILAVKRLTK